MLQKYQTVMIPCSGSCKKELMEGHCCGPSQPFGCEYYANHMRNKENNGAVLNKGVIERPEQPKSY